MPEISKTHLGGTMRLGLRPTLFGQGSETWSKIRALYGGADAVWERHRHRYEINPKYIERIERGSPQAPVGLSASAKSPVNGERPSTPLGQRMRSLPTSPSMNREDQFFGGDATSSLKPWADTLVFVGRSESGERMQVAELQPTQQGDEGHPYFVGMQAHPEFASRPLNPSPPFLGFVAAAAGGRETLSEQMARQRNFRPPHPPSLMILESERLRRQEAKEQQEQDTATRSKPKAQANGRQSTGLASAAEIEGDDLVKPATTPPGAVSPTRRQSVVEGR